MAKFTDAWRATLSNYFNTGDQPTEAQFTQLMLSIQEGIEETLLDGTGDGDSSVSQTGILMAEDGWAGIGAALERFIFDGTLGNIRVMGADFCVGIVDSAGHKLNVETATDGKLAAYLHNIHATNGFGLLVQAGDDAAVYTAHFMDVSAATLLYIRSDGNVGIGTTVPTSPLQVIGLPIFANNAAALAGALTAGAFYRTNGDPDTVCVVH
jgi:hypothetical protein